MHFLYSKFQSNAKKRTSARRKSRGSRKKWVSWLLERVNGGTFSVQTTAKMGTNTSPFIRLDCCLIKEALTGKPAWETKSHLCPRSHSHDRNKIRRQFPGVLSLWVIFGGSSETSKLCIWPQQHLLFSCPATVQHMGLSKWLGGDMSSFNNLNITEGIVFSAKAVEPAFGS